MNKKYNNDSDIFSEWTTKKLKEWAISLDDSINGPCACYGRSDLMNYSGVMKELEERGVEISSKIVFN